MPVKVGFTLFIRLLFDNNIFVLQKKVKQVNLSFAIDCSTPVEDEIMDAGSFVS